MTFSSPVITTGFVNGGCNQILTKKKQVDHFMTHWSMFILMVRDFLTLLHGTHSSYSRNNQWWSANSTMGFNRLRPFHISSFSSIHCKPEPLRHFKVTWRCSSSKKNLLLIYSFLLAPISSSHQPTEGVHSVHHLFLSHLSISFPFFTSNRILPVHSV